MFAAAGFPLPEDWTGTRGQVWGRARASGGGNGATCGTVSWETAMNRCTSGPSEKLPPDPAADQAEEF